VRGDNVVWMSGTEDGLEMMPTYMKKVDTFVSELAPWVPELSDVPNRSQAMVTCYPGGGAADVRHCDNHCVAGEGEKCNGRRVTVLIYLNKVCLANRFCTCFAATWNEDVTWSEHGSDW
jgi:hypoxia-inducible factor (prolyl hydroxylase)